MAYNLDPLYIITALSGAALMLLGLVLLQFGKKGRGSIALALFAVLWGAQIIAANISRMAMDEASLSFWVHTWVALQIPIYVPLIYFAVVHVRAPRFLGQNPLFPVFLSIPAATVLVLMAAEPGLFVATTLIDAQGQTQMVPGPLLQPLVSAPFFHGFAVALLLAYLKYEREKSPSRRERLVFVPAALVAYVGYISTRGFTTILLSPPAGAAAWLGIMAPGILVTLLILVGAARRLITHRSQAFLLLFLAAVPAGVGVAEAFGNLQGLRLETTAVWRLVLVGLVVYGVVRYHLFDVDLRMQKVVRQVTLAGLFGVTFFVVSQGADRYLSQAAAAASGIVVASGLVFFLTPLRRLAARVAGAVTPGVRETDAYLYERKIDVYRAALEEAIDRGYPETTETNFLDDLKRRLEITDEEHRLLRHLVETEERRPSRTHRGTSLIQDRFRPLKELGRGGFGRAVLAHDETLGRDVVLKQPAAAWLIDREARDTFLREARIMARIQHPNVVTIYEVQTDEQTPTLVLEYIDGGSLHDLLEARGCLPAVDALRVVDDVLAGLARVHQDDIVHRDLKPANILITRDGVAKVTDFGVARAPETVSHAVTITAANTQPGSIAYMSPEQARGDSVDGRSDLYAVGVILYQMLSGTLPYTLTGLETAEARARIQTSRVRLPADGVPACLEPLLRKALAKDPAKRHGSAKQMAAALQRAAERLPIKEGRARTGKRPRATEPQGGGASAVTQGGTEPA